jgi:hypothetical protein
MIDTPQSSQVRGMVWNISYAHFIFLGIMYHLDLTPLTRDEQRSCVGVFVDGRLVPLLHC